jgi:hypothetical protein
MCQRYVNFNSFQPNIIFFRCLGISKLYPISTKYYFILLSFVKHFVVFFYAWKGAIVARTDPRSGCICVKGHIWKLNLAIVRVKIPDPLPLCRGINKLT